MPEYSRYDRSSADRADDAGTRVDCDADVHVGGLIAAVGSRLVDAAAKKLADDFFCQIAAELAAGPPASRQ